MREVDAHLEEEADRLCKEFAEEKDGNDAIKVRCSGFVVFLVSSIAFKFECVHTHSVMQGPKTSKKGH